jgi:VanZ family protein
MLICAIPGNRIPHLTFLEWLKPDKVVHLIIFGILCIFLLRGFLETKSFRNPEKALIRWSLFISIAYGTLVEFLQYTIFINRSGDIRDAIANAIGAFLGLWVYRRFIRRSAGEPNA